MKRILILIALCVLNPKLQAQPSFAPATDYVVGNTLSVTAADLNEDGKVDLIGANLYANTLSVLTNDGSGGFVTAGSYAVGANPFSVVAVDVNGDGKLDLISANVSANTLSVLTNDGSGGFVLASSPAVDRYPISVVAADVNGDGKVDLISANYSANTLSVLTNDGSGGFVLASSPVVGSQPASVTAADVNGDGKVDLISANAGANTLSVLTNNGNGEFVTAGTYAVGADPYSVVAADINGDGKLDLICANYSASTLSVLTNDGSGGFVLASSPSVGSNPRSVVAVDVNGDSRVDLISANVSANTLSVLTNDGSGGFVLASSPAVGAGPSSITATDVNRDGKLDLISANYNAGTLSVVLNTSTFPATPPLITSQPKSQTIVEGTSASLTVTAMGSAPLSYQWQSYGTDISGATNTSLVFTNAQLTNGGVYSVLVSNSFGFTNSANAVLQVLPPGAPSIQVNGQLAVGTMTVIDSAQVTISGGFPGGFIFVTLDGSVPSFSSPLYTSAISLTNSATVQAMSLSADFSQIAFAPAVQVQITTVYNLQTSVVGSGTVSVNPPTGPYLSNSVVTLTATPGANWLFDHWRGDVTGSQNPLSVTMNGPRIVQAVFVPVPFYNLQTSAIGSGTISVNPPIGPYLSNSVVTLTATPAANWLFDHWTGDATGSVNPLNVTMNGPRTVQGVFVQTYPVTVSTPGGGNVTVNGQAIAPATFYPVGTVLTLTATASSGWSFLRWQGDATGTSNPLNVTVNQTNNIQAIFGTVVATNPLGAGSIVLSQPNPVPFGAAIIASAVPDSGKYFLSWGGAASGTNSPTTITVTNNNPTVSALFTTLPVGKYSLGVVVVGNGSVAISPQQHYYNPGDIVTLTATPSSGGSIMTNFFETKTAGDANANTNVLSPVSASGTILINYDFFAAPDSMDVYYDGMDVFSTGLINGAGTFTVPFGPGVGNSITIIMDQNGNSGGNSTWIYTPEVIQENFDYRSFKGWSGDASGTNISISVVMNANKVVQANFVDGQSPLQLQLTGAGITNGVFHFVLNGPVGSNYVIQVSSNLVNWSALSTNTIPAGGLINLIDLTSSHRPRQFYRALPFGGLAGGTVVAWGDNTYGQTNVPPGLTNVIAVAGGMQHSLALDADGMVSGWGENDFGQTNVPVGLSHVTAVAAGYGTSVALKQDSTLEEWGWDGGYGLKSTAESLTNITAISACWDCLMALKSDSTVFVWGKSTHGETNVPAGLTNAVAVAGGGYQCMALKNDGTVVVWGDNSSGQTNVPSDLTNVVAIASGSSHCLALKADFTLVAWGNNSSGQTNAPAGLANVMAISAGTAHSLALKNDGTVAAWGDNSSGQTNLPVGLTNVTAISAGGSHNLAVTNH